ncbi:hypothetical protein ACPF8X_08585 [Streptomyces sp. G35A]
MTDIASVWSELGGDPALLARVTTVERPGALPARLPEKKKKKTKKQTNKKKKQKKKKTL